MNNINKKQEWLKEAKKVLDGPNIMFTSGACVGLVQQMVDMLEPENPVIETAIEYVQAVEGDSDGPISFQPYTKLRDAVYGLEGVHQGDVD